MKSDESTPSLISGLIGWVAGNPNHAGLWRFMHTPGSAYSMGDFEQDLWLAWLETSEVELTGDFITDARSRGLFGVLNRIDYWYRKKRLLSIDAPTRLCDGHGLVTSIETPESHPKAHDAAELKDRPITRRWVVRRLASIRTERELEAFELASPCPTSFGFDNSTLHTHVALSRRNWWRILNS